MFVIVLSLLNGCVYPRVHAMYEKWDAGYSFWDLPVTTRNNFRILRIIVSHSDFNLIEDDRDNGRIGDFASSLFVRGVFSYLQKGSGN